MGPAEAEKVEIDVSMIPESLRHQIGAATVAMARRIQRDNPLLWAKIKTRAAEIREGRAPEYGGK